MKSGQKKRLSKVCTNEKGYTLIIAIVIMVVLLIVGTAVITVAANSLNTVNRRVDSRQTYYVAKSAMNVIDRSMMKEDTDVETKKGLGQHLKEKAYQTFSSEPDPEKITSHDLTIQSVNLEGMEGCSVKDMKISYKGKMTSIVTEDAEQAYSLELSNIVVSFTAVCGEQTYKIKAIYTYNGIATEVSSGSGIEWSGDTWVNTSVSQ